MTDHQGSARQAVMCFVRALAEHIILGDQQNVGHCLGAIAGVAARLGRPEQAARLFGAADRLFERLGTSVWPVDRVDYERNLAIVRARLGEDAFAAVFATGRALTLEHAIAEASTIANAIDIEAAVVETTAADAMPAMARAWGLTPRELEVLRLVSRHATNREIAAQLSISPRTVMHHVSHILVKLGVVKRRDAAELAARFHLT